MSDAITTILNLILVACLIGMFVSVCGVVICFIGLLRETINSFK